MRGRPHKAVQRRCPPQWWRKARGFTLAEIVASLALIAVVGVLLVQMFVTADVLADKAHRLDAAVSLCASIADRWKSGHAADAWGEIPALRACLQADGDRQWSLPLDAQLRPCEQKQAAYVLQLQATQDDDGVHDLQIRVVSGADATTVLHQITVSRYFAPEGGSA